MDRPIRKLVGWLEQEEAVNTLLGRLPTPGEDISAHITAWEAMRAAVVARPTYDLPTPVLEPLPELLAEQGTTFTQRADVRASFARFDWQLGIVNLERVLTFQDHVILEQVEERVAMATQDNLEALFSLSLPEAAPPQQLAVLLDQDGKGITLSSL